MSSKIVPAARFEPKLDRHKKFIPEGWYIAILMNDERSLRDAAKKAQKDEQFILLRVILFLVARFRGYHIDPKDGFYLEEMKTLGKFR